MENESWSVRSKVKSDKKRGDILRGVDGASQDIRNNAHPGDGHRDPDQFLKGTQTLANWTRI